MKILVISLVFAFLMTTAIIQMASGANDLNVSINKVATPIVGTCNNFQVELNITGKAPSKPVDVVIVIDISGSMNEGSSPTSLDYAKSSAKSFSYNILHTNPQSRIGLVTFSDTATKVLDFTSNPSTVNTSINGLTASGYTNIDAGIYTAYHAFTFRNGCKYGSTIVLLTDGVANRDRNGDSCLTWPTSSTLCTTAAINSGIAAQNVALVFCIGLLGDVHTNYPSSENIARNTLIAMQNGGYYQTYQGADLQGIYATISSKLNTAAVNALVIDTVANTFNIISGTVNLNPSNRGTVGTVGNVITWTFPTLTSETLKLKYNVTAKSGTCGTQSVNSQANMSYTTAGCIQNTLTFSNPMVDCTCITVSLSPLSGELNCNVASILLTATVTNGKAPFTYKWYNGSTLITGATSSTYTVTAPGSYTVVVNDANLCSGTSAVSTITQVRNPIVSLSPLSGELNCNVASILLTATVTNGKAPFTYKWYNGSILITGATSSTYTVTAPGSYTVVVNDANLCSGTSAVSTITQVRNPIVSLSPLSGELNCNVASILLTATVTNGKAPFTYKWYNGSILITGATSSTYTVTAPGSYTVVVNDANLCSGTSAVSTITQVRNPIVSLSPLSGELNCNVASILLTATVTNGKAPFTYKWYNGSTLITGATSSTYTVTAPGSYTVVVNDANLCSGTSAVSTITQVRNPIVSLSPLSGELNCNVASILLTATVTNGKAPFTYKWYNGSTLITGATSSTYTVTAPGSYTVVVNDANLCSGTSAVSTITQVRNPIVSLSPLSGELNCNVASILLTATVTNGKAPFTYKWYNGSILITGATSSTYTVTAPGSYTVVVNDANLCSGTSAVSTITQVRNPIVSLSPLSGELNCNVASILLTATVTNGKAPFTYKWYNGSTLITGATSSTYTVTAPGSYTVVVNDANLCSGTSAVSTITQVRNPIVSLSPLSGELNCNVASILLTATVTNGKAPFTYKWYNGSTLITGATSSTYTVTAPGSYTVVVNDANLCSGTSAVSTITQVRNPIVSLSPLSGELNCNVASILLTATVTNGKAPFTYKWYNGSTLITGATSSTYTVTAPGSYTVVVNDDNLCSGISEISTITKVENLTISISPTSGELDGVSSILLTATAYGGKGTLTYQWYKVPVIIPGATENTYTATTAGNYSVIVTDENGCTGIAMATITKPSIAVTKSASPNKAAYLGNITFTINVTDVGDTSLDPVKVTDVLPSGLTYSSDDRGGTVSGKNITWSNVGPLASNISTVIHLYTFVDGDQFGSLTNKVTVIAHTPYGNDVIDNVTAVVEALYNPGISITKNATPTTASPGDNVTFIINATNTGNVPLPTVRVVDVLPVSMVYVSDNRSGTVSGNLITWSNVGPLAVKQSTYIRLNATVSL